MLRRKKRNESRSIVEGGDLGGEGGKRGAKGKERGSGMVRRKEERRK